MAAKQPAGHLNLFPSELPKDQITIVINKIRGIDDGRSNRDRIEAIWWIAGYGASFIPDTHPAMTAAPLSDGDCCTHLESVAKGEKHGLIPWDLIVTKLWNLFLAWINGQ